MDKFLKLSFINHLRNHDEIAGQCNRGVAKRDSLKNNKMY